MFHPTEPRVIGILDWELCTTGSPLADLANLLLPFSFRPVRDSALLDSSQKEKADFVLLLGLKDVPTSETGLPQRVELESWWTQGMRAGTEWHGQRSSLPPRPDLDVAGWEWALQHLG